MDNREFDKRVRELMEGHLEMPDSSLWDSIATSLAQRKRARVLYMRRALIGTAAVAASLALIFFLDSGESTAPSQKAIIENLAQEIETTPQRGVTDSKTERVVSSNRTHIKETNKELTAQVLPEQKGEEMGVVVKEEILESAKETEKETAKEPIKVSVQESVKDPAKKAEDRSYLFENSYNRRSHRRGSTLLAVSTNISPSTASNSVSLMGLSQAQSGYSVSNVVPTFQKAYVPQEVISNTKFLMPISLGVQAQFPLTGKLSVATGLNYTLLFSHYDAISRDETRETQQTLHYIGVPLNLYYNLFNKESLRVYVSTGVAAEKGLYADYEVFESGVRRTYGQSIEGLQWSVNGGFGVEFQVNNSAGLYFDPSVAYYFDNNQPLSIRSSQPLQFKFELGFRFRL
ncbi:MAG: outer membrane beta-barrel protein [Bacteroidales bacterium]|nr:outer membrane beta-barrel protein [Bacteroidales bacterium]